MRKLCETGLSPAIVLAALWLEKDEKDRGWRQALVPQLIQRRRAGGGRAGAEGRRGLGRRRAGAHAGAQDGVQPAERLTARARRTRRKR